MLGRRLARASLDSLSIPMGTVRSCALNTLLFRRWAACVLKVSTVIMSVGAIRVKRARHPWQEAQQLLSAHAIR